MNRKRRRVVKSTTIADRLEPSRHHSPPEHQPRDDQRSKPPVKSGSWLNTDGPVALKSRRSPKPAYSTNHHRYRAPPPTPSSNRDFQHSRHDERPQNEPNALLQKSHRPHLNRQNLVDLEELLASIGFIIDHHLTERDLDQLEDQFGPKAIDDLCTKVLGAPRSDGGGRFDEHSARMGHVEQDPAVAQQLVMLEMGVCDGAAMNLNQSVPGKQHREALTDRTNALEPIAANVSINLMTSQGTVIPMEITAHDFASLAGKEWLNDVVTILLFVAVPHLQNSFI